MSEDTRATSRKTWNSGTTLADINAGSLQRIADATEKMAASYDSMRSSRDYWERRAKEETEAARRLVRRVNALRGVITRLKRAK
jgi:selenocysteine lyase/cysteine desulfurase